MTYKKVMEFKCEKMFFEVEREPNSTIGMFLKTNVDVDFRDIKDIKHFDLKALLKEGILKVTVEVEE